MYRSKNRAFLARRSEGLYIEDIEPELTVTNYKDKFHKLLCWEEMEHITVLHERYGNFLFLYFLCSLYFVLTLQ